MKVASVKGVAVLAGILLVGFALIPYARSFGGRKGVI